MEEEHIISEREKQGWQESKKRPVVERPTLDRRQRITFFKLVAQLASPSIFERKLGLAANDVEFYKTKFDIANESDARRIAKHMEREDEELYEAQVLENSREQKEAAAVANERLRELEEKRSRALIESQRNRVKIDANEIRREDAERQKRFEAQQEVQEAVINHKWTLEIDSTETVDRFRRDITNHGLLFCSSKYNATTQDIRKEAKRLKLDINWDKVRR